MINIILELLKRGQQEGQVHVLCAANERNVAINHRLCIID